MMRSVSISILLALAAVVHASIPQLTLRAISMDKIEGFYSLSTSVGSRCPRNITHQRNPVDSAIPHSTIDMNERQCDLSGDGTELTLYDDPEEVKGELESEISQGIVDDFTASIDTIIYGVESEPRRCERRPPAGSFLAAGTLVMFFEPDDNVFVGGVPYEAGRRFMVISDPNNRFCVYSGRRIPRRSPSPTPSASPIGTPEDPSPEPPASPSPTRPSRPPTTTSPPSSTGSSTTTTTGPGPETTTIPPPVSPGPSPGMDASPENTPDGDGDGPVCFPADATVELEDGSVRTMALVQLGDRVKVTDGVFSDVFMFTHKDATTVHKFIKISTEAGVSLSLTGGHYMYINGGVAAADTVKVGDIVELGTGERTFVSGVSEVTKTGLYNPQTVHGDIIVNSIRASSYTRVVEPSAAQALMAPLRLLYGALGWSVSFLDNGADTIAQLLPRGRAEL